VTQREQRKDKDPHIRTPDLLQKSRLNILVLVALIVICMTLLVGFYFGIEIEKPILEVQGVPAFVGNERSTVNFRALDTGSGVDSIKVEIEQAGVTLPIGRFEPQGIVHDFPGTFLLSKSIAGLREGQAMLRVEAKDRSLWGSGASVVFPVIVDSFEPSLQLLSAPRKMESGGAGLFVYKAGDANLTSSGLALGKSEELVGRPAVLMDPDLLQSDLFALIANAPTDGRVDWTVFASDVAGHNVSIPVSVELQSVPASEKTVSEYVSEGALIRLLANLSQEAASNIGEAERRKIESFRQELEATRRKGAIDFMLYLVTTIRAKELDAIRARLIAELPTPRRWQGEMFIGPFSPRLSFGDKVVVGDEQGEFASWISPGEVLEPIGDARAVVAPYAGIVRMAGRLGTLGEIVVVDHGAGLASVFYSLEQRHVFEGTVVAQGQVLADVGASGLHFSRAARLLFLVNGRPVNPAFWRHPSGFPATVEGALNGIKSALGIESSSAG
jgi:hypothetical protein